MAAVLHALVEALEDLPFVRNFARAGRDGMVCRRNQRAPLRFIRL
jgi:hypothetical protein